jgi:hypothetical protein
MGGSVHTIKENAEALVVSSKEIGLEWDSRVSFCNSLFYDDSLYDLCRVGPSTPDLWCITVTIQASFLYLVRF